MPVQKFIDLVHSNRKWRIFSLILLAIAVVGTLLSMLARVTVLRDDESTRPRLAIVAPDTPAGATLRQGAAIYLERLNAAGGYRGRPVEPLLVAEGAPVAEQVLADKRVIAVMGHLDESRLREAAPRYRAAQLPVVSPLALPQDVRQTGVISLGHDPREEARFVANYARNIQQQRLMHVVREEGPAADAWVEPLADLYQRFETPIRQTWSLPAQPTDAQVEELLAALAKIDVGALYLATQPELAARLVHRIRAKGIALDLFGPSALATSGFLDALQRQSGPDTPVHAHGIVVATPVLFDTANDEAQRFQTRYQQRFVASPDWLATLGYEAARWAVQAAAALNTTSAALQADAPRSLLGDAPLHDGQVTLPIQMGQFNGDRLISAPVQLLPLAKGASFNYIDALRQGRMLYVNDRFMFKTNVVYVGVNIHEIADIDRQKESATLDLSIWFRYRGKFDPQDLQIANASVPIRFDKPEEVKDGPDVQYRRYRIRQTFSLNFTTESRAYNQLVAGLQFRHRLLNRNNLTYVVDVLGMPSGQALLQDMQQRRVIKAGGDWEVANAWFSQDLVRERGEGAPQYVGMTGEQASFSTVTLGVLLRPAALSARDVIDQDYFVYLGIFGALGVLVSMTLDASRRVRHWAVQSWLLRVIFWPMLLLALGNLVIDWAFHALAPSTTKTVVMVYESLWWLLSARLIDMALRRFVWHPLETSAQRKVPNVVKVMVTMVLFALALAGIVSFVMGKALTSLLATSGLLALIIGVAIRPDIANIFSGIVLNIERPFKVGDYIKINNVIGQVKDITWRTIRVESNEGPMVSLANSRVSSAFMENYSDVPHGIEAETVFHTPADVDPAKVLAIVNEAIAANRHIICKDQPPFDPMPRYKGIVNVNGQWVAAFSAGYRVKILPKKSKAKEDLWNFVRERFLAEGIPLMPAPYASSVTVVAESKGPVSGASMALAAETPPPI